jgi:DNA-binding transcriptional LysR family regulator
VVAPDHPLAALEGPIDTHVLHLACSARNMPSHLVQNDIAQGRLKVIRPVEFDSRGAQLTLCGAYLADHRLGAAGQWMIDHLSAVVGS